MQCSQFHDRMNELLDQRLDPSDDASLQRHAKSCDRCERDLGAYLLLEQALAFDAQATCVEKTEQAEVDVPDHDLAARTALRSPSASPQRSGWATWFSIAAAILLLVFVPKWRANRPAPLTTATAGHAAEQRRTAATAPAATVPTARVMSAATVPQPTALSAQTPGGFVQPLLGLRLVAAADWSQLEPMEMPFDMPLPHVETDSWIQSMADEMGPLKRSVDSTVNLIVNTLST